MSTRTTNRRASLTALVMTIATSLVALAPAALAGPIEGTGGAVPAPRGTAPVVRTVTETVAVGVPWLTVMAIGVLAFSAAWVLATLVAGHRVHRTATG